MPDSEQLRRILERIDGRGYKAYKDVQGSYDFGSFVLHIDHVQGDPFAAPSKVRVRVPQRVAELPPELAGNAVRRVALEDFLARTVSRAIRATVGGRRGTGKSGLIAVDAGGQEVIERTAVVVTPDWVEARLEVGLPAAGRRVLGRQAEAMLCDEMPRIVEQGLLWRNLPQQSAQRFVECIENFEHIRGSLEERGLIAFVADGAVLPRESGASDRPLNAKEAVAFQSPESFRVTMDLPNALPAGERAITGMGIPKGVTLIVGGGYHGKSTLLNALERGVYPHIPSDGREYVVTSRDAVKIRAEDGRRVERVNIDPFISNLPYGRSTAAFSTDDASGSTSQAADIIEALEVGAKVLLVDEDTSATNFMVRDARMQALVHKEHEPITPFIDRVRELYVGHGVSTILVMGGCGDYFDVADHVIMMRDYLPIDASADARALVRDHATQRRAETTTPMPQNTARIPLAESFDPSRGRRDVKIDAKALDLILFGTEAINLRGVEQLVDVSQTRAVGHAIHLAVERFMDGNATLREVVDRVDRFFDENGLDALDPFHRNARHPGNYARPRKYEVAAAINRLRSLRMRQDTS
ncbi:MAG TPA: ABC-ATPase domain-containing protein [Candidatus Hydrogenedentes bacterium]|nr:ABC-ATPase domain-containing protein [Candidatus Hydrogenedentota bacterium]